MAIAVDVQMQLITCPSRGCGIVFAVPSSWENRRRQDHTGFYCPNGHLLSFSSETKAEQLERRLAQERASHDQTKALAREAGLERDRAHEALAKQSRRVANGVCPCCQRSFCNLQRHMKTQHPDYGPRPEPGKRRRRKTE